MNGKKVKGPFMIALLFIFSFRIISCGRSAPPIAKDMLFPKRPLLKKAIYRDGFLFVLLKMEDEEFFSYFSLKRCDEKEKRVESVKEGDTYFIRVEGKPGCSLLISTRNKYGRGESGVFLELPSEIPQGSPVNFSAVRFSNRVEILFPEEGFVNIYREPSKADFPINDKPLRGPIFIDYNVEPEKEYRYALRSVYYINGIEVEGGIYDWKVVPSANALLLPPPLEITAKIDGRKVVVEWMPVLSEDLMGYNIYVWSEEKAFKVNALPVKETRFEFKQGELKGNRIGISSVNKMGGEGEIKWVKIR